MRTCDGCDQVLLSWETFCSVCCRERTSERVRRGRRDAWEVRVPFAWVEVLIWGLAFIGLAVLAREGWR